MHKSKLLSVILCISLAFSFIISMPGMVSKQVRADSDDDSEIYEYCDADENHGYEYAIEDGQLIYKYQVINDQIADYIERNLLAHNAKIDISQFGLPYGESDGFFDDIHLISDNNPELFAVGNLGLFAIDGVYKTLSVNYRFSTAEVDSIMAKINDVSKLALSNIKPYMTDYERALVLHDWLANYVEHGYEGDYRDLIYGALIDRCATERGIVPAYIYLMRAAGFEIYSVSDEHRFDVWTLVKIGNDYYYIDVAEDDAEEDILGRVEHDYFLVNDATLTAKKHSEPFQLPAGFVTATRFDNALWHGIDSMITAYNGGWYYCKGNANSRTTDVMHTASLENGPEIVIANLGDKGVFSNNYLNSTYSHSEVYEHYLIFNGNDCIMYIDLANADYPVETMYTAEELVGVDVSIHSVIYHFDVDNGWLYYGTGKTSSRSSTTFSKVENKLIQPATNPIVPEPQPEPGKEPEKEVTFEEFVERLYTVALGRPSEQDGKAYWCDQVVNKGFTGADCARFFLLDAPEFMNRNLPDDQFVEVLYQTFFGRESEADGKAYWLGRLASGSPKIDLVNDFIESVEWCNICATYGVKSGAIYHKATVPSKNATKFATRLYTCCLGREPEADGLAYWSLALTNADATGYQAASLFFTLPEFQNLNASNEEFLRRLYTTFMGRTPEADGFNYWLQMLIKGTSREDVMKAFAGCAEFQAICNQYGIVRGDI
ncbi:MAG: DUF4214 domain-containing protein [Clostridiales bacterium]|nr:DUF4214 domain-containing protein [Clostridiales bacterium]